MTRVTKFTLDGVSLDIASMSVREAEKFVEDGRAIIARMKEGETVTDEWLKRRDEVIAASLKKAGQAFHVEQLKDEFDLPTLDALYQKILDFSGLKMGEATAAVDSQKSAVA